MSQEKFARILEPLNTTQLTGLGCLAFLAIREKSSLQYQWKEWGFSDISIETILECELYDPELRFVDRSHIGLRFGGFDRQ